MEKSLPHDVYNEIADVYALYLDKKPHNAFYDRPAVQSLIPDIKDKKVLDAGCGPGVYAEWMIGKGAVVTGIDSSEKLIAYARKRNGDKVEFHHANMENQLSFLQDDSFDGILCALAISYIKDHSRLFREFNRILRPNGWFVLSTEHPFSAYKFFNIENYFDTKQVSGEWNGFGKKVMMPSYYHSFNSIANALTDNGFIIDKILEPKPTDDFKKVDPAHYEKLMKFPLFICIRARKSDCQS